MTILVLHQALPHTFYNKIAPMWVAVLEPQINEKYSEKRKKTTTY